MSARKKRISKKKRAAMILRRIAVALLVILFIAVIYCALSDVDPFAAAEGFFIDLAASSPAAQPEAYAAPEKKTLDAYVIDVGQGDCILLISPNGKTMLVDAGEATEFYAVRSLLKSLGISKLDVVVATHPHDDHIGGMPAVFRSFEVGALYMPDVDGLSEAYAALVSAMSRQTLKLTYASASRTPIIAWDDDVTVEVLSPFDDVSYENLNDYSVMLRVSYGGTSIMLTGDAEGASEYSAEYAALARFKGERFRSTVLKVGHHGSFSSTSDAFLAAVEPDYAVISVGKNNDYAHPHKSTLAKLKACGADVFRTDELGTIHVAMDGETTVISSVQRSSASLWSRVKGWFE